MLRSAAIARHLGGLATLVVLAGVWWVFVQGRADAWLVGIPAIALAAFAVRSLGHAPMPTIQLAAVPHFAGLFLVESFRGGIDVARRILGKKTRIAPGFRLYHPRLRNPSARVLLINCIGLLPGTLAADYQGDVVELHLIDVTEDPEPQLKRLEQAVARLFGLTGESGHD